MRNLMRLQTYSSRRGFGKLAARYTTKMQASVDYFKTLVQLPTEDPWGWGSQWQGRFEVGVR